MTPAPRTPATTSRAARRVVVTRADPEARQWAERLAEAGHHPVCIPLLATVPTDNDEQVASVWQTWHAAPSPRAVMFVSPAAAQHALGRPRVPALWPDGLRAWCTGPGSAAALVALGVPAHQIDQPPSDAARLDSEALWAQVRDQVQVGDTVWLVRGRDPDGQPGGRDWLALQLAQAGAAVRTLWVYQRVEPVWTDAVRREAVQACSADTVWLLSSSQAVSVLASRLSSSQLSATRALATHPRIVETALKAGFGRVDLSRPDFDAVRAYLESGT